MSDKHRYSPDEKSVLRGQPLSDEKRCRNLVEAFQTAMREKHIPTYRVLGYKSINKVNVRVTYTAPVWGDEPQRALIRRYSTGLVTDRTTTWTALKGDEGKGGEIVRFETSNMTNEFVRVF